MPKFLRHIITFFLLNNVALTIHPSVEPLEKSQYKDFNVGEVQQIDDKFYVGRMISAAGVKLWLVMEKIDEFNFSSWLEYISVQSHPRAIDYAYALAKDSPLKGNIADGSCHFQKVLSQTSYKNNEIWVAYITKAKTPFKIIDRDNGLSAHYSATNWHMKDDRFAKDIEMFMTVTSTPEALITSHMGIAGTLEGIQTRQKGISLDLHSFAAKVMLMRNQHRKLMVNAPVFAMENLIANSLPDHTFVGTRQMQKEMEYAQNIDLEQYIGLYETSLKEQLRSTALNYATTKNNQLKREMEAFDAGRRKGRTREDLCQYVVKLTLDYHSINFDSEKEIFIVSEEKIEASFKKQLEDKFHWFKNPYYFPASSSTMRSQEFLKFMEKHPPILSIGRIQEGFSCIIYDPANPEMAWLSIDQSNQKIYDWMTLQPFAPLGLTHYIAVDLVALAKVKPLIKIEPLELYENYGAPFKIIITEKDYEDVTEEAIKSLINNPLVVDLTIYPPRDDRNANYQQLIKEAFLNKPNLRRLTIKGNFDTDAFFHWDRKCVGNLHILPLDFLKQPHLEFFARLEEFKIEGYILGANCNDNYFAQDFISYLKRNNNLKIFTFKRLYQLH